MTKPSLTLSLPLLALLLAPATGHAFNPDGDLGALRGPTRVIVAHDAIQAQMSLRSASWQRFVAEQGGDWQILWDETSGSAHRIWGSGIDLGDTQDLDALATRGRALLARHSDLTGVSVADFELKAANTLEGLTTLSFQRTVKGVPVFESLADLVFENGRLVSMGFDTYPELSADTIPTFRADRALAAARAQIPARTTQTVKDAGSLFVLPLERDGALTYPLAWRTVVATDGPQYGEWITWTDAHTGEVLSQHNGLTFASGVIEIEYEERTVGDDLVLTPAQYAEVSAGVSGDTTDSDGVYDVNGSSLTTRFTGPFVNVTSQKTRNASASFSGGDFVWAWGEDATAAEASTFVATNAVRNRALATTPTLPELQDTMNAIVNKFGTCNAFYNGNINFLSETPLCNNTGRIQDVIFHEYGHHYHYSLADAGVIAGDIGEGSGDFLSATITGSPIIAPKFSKTGGGTGAIREIETDRVYPQDVTGSVHTDGLIWAGAMWDLRKLLIAEYGDTLGVRKTDVLFAKALMQGPRLSNCYQAVLTADDDDGNLANGTPNKALIDEAFDAHGLTVGL